MVARLRTLLFDDDARYREEVEKMVPTILDRQAENRERLKQLRDRKEKERLELVQQKYLQQAAYVSTASPFSPRRVEHIGEKNRDFCTLFFSERFFTLPVSRLLIYATSESMLLVFVYFCITARQRQ